MARPASISRKTAREIHGLCKTGSAKKDLAAIRNYCRSCRKSCGGRAAYEWLEDDLVSYRLLRYLPKLGARKAAFLTSADPEGCGTLVTMLEGLRDE